jgi:hypothetical protein
LITRNGVRSVKREAKAIRETARSGNNIARCHGKTARVHGARPFPNLFGALRRFSESAWQASLLLSSYSGCRGEAVRKIGLEVVDILEPDLQADQRAVIGTLGDGAVGEKDRHG